MMRIRLRVLLSAVGVAVAVSNFACSTVTGHPPELGTPPESFGQKNTDARSSAPPDKLITDPDPSPADGRKPFALSESELGRATILLAFLSGKTGAGKQEIEIRGDGTVSLFFSRSAEDTHPKKARGRLDPEIVRRLLDFMEGNDFFSLNELYPAQNARQAGARRALKLSLPNREKTVVIEGAGLYSIEQMVGAVRLTAGIAVPEAINHRFFPNL